ncbi:exported hypothetical protein [Thiocapsa sp. KS1]|nr:exported hypothetical protein [Thiocapsa sp. KS1]
MNGRFMTPLLLVASLVLGVASAAANRDAFGAQPWTSAEQPTWGGAPADSGGYGEPWPDRERQPPYSYPDDGARGTRNGTPEASRYDGGDVAPGARQEFRFRGDPEPGSSQWSRQDLVDGYRFRPLTGQEAERQVQTPGWRPLEPVGPDRGGRTPSAPPGLMDALTPPARTFGFEPAPWP